MDFPPDDGPDPPFYTQGGFTHPHATHGHGGPAMYASQGSSASSTPSAAAPARQPAGRIVTKEEHVAALHRAYMRSNTLDLPRMLASQFYLDQLASILMHDDEQRHFGVAIRMEDLMQSCPALGSLLGSESGHVILTLENALRAAEEAILTGPLAIPARDRMCFKYHVHARIGHLFSLPTYVCPRVSAIRSSDCGRFIQVSGTVIRTGSVRMVERVRFFKCTNSKCGFEFPVNIEIEHDNTIEMPRMCPNPSLPNGKRCTGSSFKPVEGKSVKVDYQEIKLQELVSSLEVGSIPRTLVVVLENDLVDSVKAGDDAVITGTVIHRWGRVSRGARCDLDLLMRANHVRMSSANGSTAGVSDQLRKDFEHFWACYASAPLRGRNAIVRSICPQLHGLYMIKLAVALVLIGGVGQTHENGTTVRGESHLLLIGDPGTGKSQFLRYAAKVIPRAVLTTGIGTTSAGLTCTAVKDSGEWVLEAGALVLADRGICCIDEFSSIREHDRTAIHEAMEQQTLSVAKAGLVCKLNARCSIIAATNPKGKYDSSVDVSANTAIASPLLSRFDLILVLLDTTNATWDNAVSSFILSQACARGDDLLVSADMRTRPLREAMARLNAGAAVSFSSTQRLATPVLELETPARPKTSAGAESVTISLELGCDVTGVTHDGGRVEDAAAQTVVWSLERVQAYITHLKAAFHPVVSKSAQEVIMRYYELQRRGDSRSAARTTLRLLESLVRLTQAHARLMWRHEACVQDAVIAVMLVETSMHASAMMTTTPVLHASFPEDPDSEYMKHEKMVLHRLGLTHLGSDAGGGGSGAVSNGVGNLVVAGSGRPSMPAPVPSTAAPTDDSLHLLSMFGGFEPPSQLVPPAPAGAARATLAARTWYDDPDFGKVPHGHVHPGDKTFRTTSMPLAAQRGHIAMSSATPQAAAIVTQQSMTQPAITTGQPRDGARTKASDSSQCAGIAAGILIQPEGGGLAQSFPSASAQLPAPPSTFRNESSQPASATQHAARTGRLTAPLANVAAPVRSSAAFAVEDDLDLEL